MAPSPAPPRAAYACDPLLSRGRVHSEELSRTRTEFQRDRDRIVHCAAFRRLAHKTQVFVPDEGDHFRTRLTHSIEVAQIARALSRALGLDEDLAEALALAHDLGHTCFGHTGEEALDSCMAPWGGFDHNAQTLRIVTRLEHRYARYDGLNLVWESVEGLVKHNGPLTTADGRPLAKYAQRGVPQPILDYDAVWPLDLARFSSGEAQAAALADDIAYDAHDIDDGLRAGAIDFEGLRAVGFIDEQLRDVDARHPNLEPGRRVHELVRRVITRFVEDAGDESRRRLAGAGVASVEDIRAAGAPMVAFSASIQEADAAIKRFLMSRLYRHPRIMRVREEAAVVVKNLFERFLASVADLPEEWAQAAEGKDAAQDPESGRARLVCDYIAGMTDRYALREHRRLFGFAPDLR
ncbi:MAG TPA: deoxyguanosinetriphosphate triphosphohydrolase [Beijerinckiaceae bacterium]|nr:deoxyguanosinetriphosphate triphosphohydrolase [Beijerinckiaceae bacterium]